MEGTVEMENIGKRTGTTDTSITNRIKEMEERISGVEDKQKVPKPKYPGNLGHNEKTKSKNTRTTRG